MRKKAADQTDPFPNVTLEAKLGWSIAILKAIHPSSTDKGKDERDKAFQDEMRRS